MRLCLEASNSGYNYQSEKLRINPKLKIKKGKSLVSWHPLFSPPPPPFHRIRRHRRRETNLHADRIIEAGDFRDWASDFLFAVEDQVGIPLSATVFIFTNFDTADLSSSSRPSVAYHIAPQRLSVSSLSPKNQESEPQPPSIKSNVKHNLQLLKLWKEFQNRGSGTAKPATSYMKKKAEKDELPDDSELYRDPTNTLYYGFTARTRDFVFDDFCFKTTVGRSTDLPDKPLKDTVKKRMESDL
ncbi:hypothetical protein HA466_0159000 [Hirschfeldia incana]|nr:hypothetical protein HA466_0159000 [Hirschfeldia incana]